MTNTQTAGEIKTLLATFNKGITEVTIEYGIVCVCVKTRKALMGVTLDLMRTRAFKSVKAVVKNIDGGFVIHAIPA